MTCKIALEEHFLTPDMIDYWLPTVETIPQKVADRLRGQLLDFDGERLETMDKAGIDIAILSLSGPGVQAEPDTAAAIRRARLANDFLAEKIARHPTRYGGFAHLAMQDGKAAAEELDRCVSQLGFHGAMIDGQTNGHYLDEPQYDVFWERAAALDAPVYLHPADPEVAYAGLRGHEKLKRATWEWGVETATHALRIVFGGVFERHPKARLALGHLGETLPYLLWRFDSRITVLYGLKRADAQTAFGVHPRQHGGHQFRHVFARTDGLRHRRAGRGQCDVLGRLPVREHRCRGGIHRVHGDVPGAPREDLQRQCRADLPPRQVTSADHHSPRLCVVSPIKICLAPAT